MTRQEIRDNSPDGANTYMIWLGKVVYFKSERGNLKQQFKDGYWDSNVGLSIRESYAYQCISDWGYINGDIKPL